jgi:glycosyltransferase involved in cell wall biosynthesis
MGKEEYDNLLKKELSLARNADAITVVSKEEQQIYLDQGYKHVHVLGHVVKPCVTSKDFNERNDILFVGNLDYDDSPNVDSVVWFVTNILSKLNTIAGLEHVRLILVGTNKSKQIHSLLNDSVVSVGLVDDLSEYYGNARIFIAPTRFAAGIPHKVHEACANGIPCVITDLLLDQLGWEKNVDILSSPVNDVETFLGHCVELYKNDKKWREIKENALRRVECDCSIENFKKTIQNVIDVAIHGKQ